MDEVSLLGIDEGPQRSTAVFGSGNLLADLVEIVVPDKLQVRLTEGIPRADVRALLRNVDSLPDVERIGAGAVQIEDQALLVGRHLLNRAGDQEHALFHIGGVDLAHDVAAIGVVLEFRVGGIRNGQVRHALSELLLARRIRGDGHDHRVERVHVAHGYRIGAVIVAHVVLERHVRSREEIAAAGAALGGVGDACCEEPWRRR